MKRPVPHESHDEPTERSRSTSSIDTGETWVRADASSSGEEALPSLPEGRYRVDESDASAVLGRGGQGVVWRAWDTVLRREVALKKLHPEALARPEVVAAFVREARLTARLEHPGIVALHDVGRGPDGSLFLVLRRIEGKSLADSLAGKALDERLAFVPALVRACQAVAFAHRRGVVHRDLKPQNVMLGGFGETWVLDWGLASIDSRVEEPEITAPHQLQHVVGTPAYMSPEAALGLEADARSDVWGLGACLYFLLTGQAPILGRSLRSAMGHAAQGEVSPVAALEPDAPEDLAAICDKALARDRERRYPDASALAADLEAWLAGRTVSARRYGRAELLRRALAANRRLVAGALLGVVVLGGVLTFDELRVRRERNEARTFVRELMRELPQEIESSRGNIAVINTLSERSLQWLGRSDLSPEESRDACIVFTRLGAINAETNAWDACRALYEKALTLSATGLARAPRDVDFFACEVDARAGLLNVDLETGATTDEQTQRRYEALWAQLLAWRGDWSPGLRLSKAIVASNWGAWLWPRAPSQARELFGAAAREVEPLLDSPVDADRRTALGQGANAVSALWSQGQLPEALALAKRFADAAARDCAEQTLPAQRACRLPAASYVSVLSWNDPPAAELLAAQQLAFAADDFVLGADVDSNTARYDSMLLHVEQGRFTEAMERARRLRLGNATSWALEMGPLAAVLAGDLAEVDAWEPHLAEAHSTGRLALGLRELARGRFAAAARHLRSVKTERLWYDTSWPAHATPALELPDAARPAFTQFIADFTRAYGAADHPGLARAVDELARAAEALATPEGK
ncbi:MAG: serine/threonine-protein kinase [Myxococcota bacterium]